ncbi:hypothetical protein EUTSA_v10002985mg [Eutrema salsugineum]|uniref:F-box associated domain-containing protein n=1 Tax=Eutrema salsugineum TaxID=72664 RepID=V4L0S0_EUTSA|nr:hypothetical protein EUTSA_v10002985mg [Eutrema salsugineum]
MRPTCKRWNALFKEGFTGMIFHKSAKQPLVLVLKQFRVWSIGVNFKFKGPLDWPKGLYFTIIEVFHYEEALLYTTKDNILMIWNPY